MSVYRQPYAQGLLETLVPLLLQYLIASFTRNWLLMYNLSFFWLVQVLLRHFKTDNPTYRQGYEVKEYQTNIHA